MPDARDDLRATSDSILSDADRLTRLEAQKQRLDPADPEVLALSQEIEELSVRLQRKAVAERELAEELQATV